MLNEPGIYKIRNIITGDFYIGSAAILRKRRDAHFSQLRRGLHCNEHLQRAFNKYGETNFVFEVLTLCSKKDTLKFEQLFLDVMQPVYNIWKQARSGLGIPCTEERKRKIGLKSAQKRHSLETRLRIGLAGKGRPSPNKGKKYSDELKKKISAGRKGKSLGHIVSEETRRKIGAKNKINRLGKKATEATKAKMRETQLKRWEVIRDNR